MRGHWYVTLIRGSEAVTFAVPAIFNQRDAVALARDAMPGWHYAPGSATWRACFDQAGLPSDSQPTYGEINTEYDAPRLLNRDREDQCLAPSASSAEPHRTGATAASTGT